MRGGRLHLQHAADGVLDLVNVVHVPTGHQQVTLVQIAAGQDPATAPQFDLGNVAGSVPGLTLAVWAKVSGRMRGDGHDYRGYN